MYQFKIFDSYHIVGDFSEEKNESVDTHAALPDQTPTRVRF